MNSQIKTQWVTALRSGKYKQTKGHLRDENGFCCLGVLCDLYRKVTGKGEWDTHPDVVIFDFVGVTSGSSALLPDEVSNWAQIESDSPTLIAGAGGIRTLSGMNDTGSTFSEIADAIEKYEII